MTMQNFQVNIDDTTFRIASDRAAAEGKTLSQAVAEFLIQYADGASGSIITAYTIQRGDTLGRIAQRFYGDARKYPVIQRANNISNPSRIWIGQVLIIPAMGNGGSPRPGPGPSPVVPPPALTPAPVPTPAPPPPAPLQPALAGIASKPSIRWVGSPNFNNRRRPDDVSAIVIHATANSTLQGVIDWFNNPSAQVSAHYTIDKDGQIVQHVQDMHRAWHTGRSIWKGRDNVNDYSLGIELVNLNDGSDPYPEVQHQAAVALVAYLAQRYNIEANDIMGHLDICLPPSRKTDPRGYDLNRLRREVEVVLGR